MSGEISRMAEGLARAQASRPWLFLAAAALVTAGAAALACGLGFDASYEALLPEDAPEVRNADDVRARTGGTRQLVVAIGGEDPEARLAFGRRAAERVRRIDRVRWADLEFDAAFFEDRAFWLLDEDTLEALVPAMEEAVRIAKWQANPMALHLDEKAEKEELEAAWQKVDDVLGKKGELPFEGVLTSEDGRYTFLLVVPSIKFSDMEAGRSLLARVRREVSSLDPEAAGVRIRYAGNLAVVQEQHETMSRDLRNASLLALLFGVVIVSGLTRRPTAPILVAASLLAGVVWTFALTRLVIGHVNIITGFLVAVLIGLGIDFGIHLYVRYRQAASRGSTSLEAMTVEFVGGTMPPALTSALTTAGTFLSFTVADFRGFSEFGLIAGVGVLLTFASSFLILPPLVVLVERRRRAGAARPAPPERADPAPGRVPTPLATVMVLAVLALAIFGVANAGDIPFRNDFRKLRGVSSASDFLEYVDENLGIGFNPAVILAGSVADADRIDRIARETAERGRPGGKRSRIGKVVSVSTLLPGDVSAKRPHVERLREILMDPKLDRAEEKGDDRAEQLRDARSRIMAKPWGAEDIPEEVRRRFTSLDGAEYLVYLWPREPNDADYQAAAWERELDDLSSRLRELGIEHSMADETLIVAWIYRLILSDGPFLLGLAAAVVLAFLLLDLRSLRRTLLLAFPLAAGMAMFVAVIRIWDLELNMFNLVILPSIVGIGIDNAVHIYHRYRSEGRGSLPLVLRRTGTAALLASLTTGAGFGSSLVSHHVGLQTLGTLAIIGISATFVAAVVFFPCALSILEAISGRSRRKPGGEERG